MNYTVTIQEIKDHMFTQTYKIWDYESKIIAINLTKELAEEIIASLEDKNCVIKDIKASHLALEQEFKNEIPKEFQDLYKKSKTAWENEEAQKVITNQYLKQGYNHALNEIRFLRNQAEKLNLLDSQDYLDFLDNLNSLSIDQDRKQ